MFCCGAGTAVRGWVGVRIDRLQIDRRILNIDSDWSTPLCVHVNWAGGRRAANGGGAAVAEAGAGQKVHVSRRPGRPARAPGYVRDEYRLPHFRVNRAFL
jgi:hypothetical protein